MALQFIITDAGLAEVVNAEQNGTAPVVLSQAGFGTGQYEASASQTALSAEFKRLNTISGNAVGDNIIHLTIVDSSSDEYECYEVGVYTDSGVLFGVASSTTPIIGKSSAAQALLAIDFALTEASPESITFGDVSLTVGPATTESQGIVELATADEVVAGTDAERVVTPATLQALTATTSRSGIVELATTSETQTGTDSARAITPYGLASRTATEGRTGIVELATTNEALAGTDTERAVTPAGLKKAIDSHASTIASASTLGHVKIGDGLSIDASGVLSIVLNSIYPVGAIYMSVNSTSPASIFGGTWEQLKDRFLVGAGSTYSVNATGGAATVTLTESQIPSHTHSFTTGSAGAHTHTRGTMNITGYINGGSNFSGFTDGTQQSGALYAYTGIYSSEGMRTYTSSNCRYPIGFDASKNWTGSTSSDGAHTHTGTTNSTGSGGSHNNLPPYLAVYMWKRTA